MYPWTHEVSHYTRRQNPSKPQANPSLYRNSSLRRELLLTANASILPGSPEP